MPFSRPSKWTLCLSFLLSILSISAQAQTPILGPAATLAYGGGSAPPFWFGANDIAISGNYVYIPATSESAFQIMDISDPLHPVPAGHILNGSGGAELSQPSGVYLAGNYAYIANRTGGGSLEIVDISNPTAPVHKGNISDGTGGAALSGVTAVFVSGNFAYLVGPDNFAMEILDVSDPAAPVHRSKLPINQNLYDVVVVGTYAYVCSFDTFYVIDVSNLDAPTIVGSISDGGGVSLEYANNFVIVGNYAYVAAYSSGALEILDISNPASPQHSGRILNGGGALLAGAESVTIEGDYAFVSARGSNAIEVVNISNPASPTHVTSIARNGSYATVINGNYLFSVGDSNFKVFSIFTPIPVTATTATVVTATSFTANWNAVSTASHYLLDVSTDNFATFVTGFNGFSQTGTSLQLTGLDPGATYKYRVRAANANGEASNSNVVSIVTLPDVAVAIPATAITATSFSANWNATAGAASYAIDMSFNSNFVNLEIDNFNVGNVTSYVVDASGRPPGTETYYRVRAINSDGVASATSNEVMLKTAPATPTATAPQIFDTGFVANWSYAFVDGNYHFDLALDEDFTSMVSGYENLTVDDAYNYVTILDLEPNTTYYYRLRASNAFATTPSSNVVSALTFPAPPTLLPATLITQTTFTVNWSPTPGLDNYLVSVTTTPYNGVGAIFIEGFENKAVSGSSADITGLSGGSTFYYWVSVVNASGNSPFSGTYVRMAPSTPVALAPISISSSSFIARWQLVEGNNEYRIDIATDEAFTSFVLEAALSYTDNLQTWQLLTPNTQYFYRVRAINESGTTINSNVISLFTSPLPPTASSATALTQTSFTANWIAAAGITEYGLDVSEDINFGTFLEGFESKLVTGTTATVSPLNPGTTYYYRVRAANVSGFSAPSVFVTVVTVPATPVPAIATNITQTSFTANWSAVPSATEYFVDVKNDLGVLLTAYTNKSTTNISLPVSTDVAAGTVYTYVVRASSASGTSPDSAPQQTLTIPPTPIAGPVGTAASPTATGFTAKWTKVKGATTYKLTAASSATFGDIFTGYDSKDVGDVASATVIVSSPPTGATYYFKIAAVNASGESPFSTPVSVTTPTSVFSDISFPTGGTQEDYRIVAIPVGTTSSTTLSADSYGKNWRIMHYNNATDQNDEVTAVSSLQVGLGYWANSNLNPAPTIKLGGSHFPQEVNLTLNPGWNQIGNPLNRSLSWDDVLLNNGPVAGNVGDLYLYERGFGTSDGLPAWAGGFVNNISTSTVTLTIPIDVAAGGRVKKSRSTIDSQDLDSDTWLLPLAISSEGGENSLGGIGMHPQANESIDRFDAVALPRFFDLPDFISPHPEYFQSRFMRDVVPSSEEMTWTFTAAGGNKKGEATLRWDNEAWKDGEAALVLFDESKQVLIDMKQVNEYSFRMSAGGKFKIFYGAQGRVAPDITGMGDPYPNPSASSVTMPFISAGEESVRIQLFDLSGRPVRSLMQNGISQGIHSINWDGHDDQGAKVPAGMYVYRFTSVKGVAKVGKIVMQ